VPFRIEWVVLTMGDRDAAMHAAVRSLLTDEHVGVVVVSNGAGDVAIPDDPRVRLVVLPENLGVPGGRHAGLAHCSAPIVGFLDDDAEAASDASARVQEAFAGQPDLAAVSFRLVDEEGASSTRHVPRPGGRNPGESGPVATFLGGASAIRRSAYDQVGGYFCALFYGHEEVELGWRLIDAGWQVRYLADVEVFHPRTEIGRHEHGWHLTGRNRVWIARRTLPWPVAIAHVTVWLLLGVVRAPDTACRRSYLSGWWQGWRTRWADGSPRRPITWRGVWRLTRLGRPPLI
jgi:GT2 family glycosyltransferase